MPAHFRQVTRMTAAKANPVPEIIFVHFAQCHVIKLRGKLTLKSVKPEISGENSVKFLFSSSMGQLLQNITILIMYHPSLVSPGNTYSIAQVSN